MPAVGAVALGQHSSVHQCSEHASACDLINTESRLRSRQRQRQCRVLEIVGLDSHDEVFNSVTCRCHCVILSEIVKRQSASRMLEKASSAREQRARHNGRAVSHAAKHRDPHGVTGNVRRGKRRSPFHLAAEVLLAAKKLLVRGRFRDLQDRLSRPRRTQRRGLLQGSDVAPFLPFECNKEQQTAARVGTRRRSPVVGYTRAETESGNTQQIAAKGG